MHRSAFVDEIRLGLATDLDDYPIIAHQWMTLAANRLGETHPAAPDGLEDLARWGARLGREGKHPSYVKAARLLADCWTGPESWKMTHNALIDVANLLRAVDEDDVSWAMVLVQASVVTYDDDEPASSAVFETDAYRWLQRHAEALDVTLLVADQQGSLRRGAFRHWLWPGWEDDAVPVGIAQDERGFYAVWVQNGQDLEHSPIVRIGEVDFATVASDLDDFVEWCAAEASTSVQQSARELGGQTAFGRLWQVVTGAPPMRDRSRIEAEAAAAFDFGALARQRVTDPSGLRGKRVLFDFDLQLVERAKRARGATRHAALDLLMARLDHPRAAHHFCLPAHAVAMARDLGRGEDALVAARVAFEAGDRDLLVPVLLEAGQADEARDALERWPTTERGADWYRLAARVHDVLGRPTEARELRVQADARDTRLQDKLSRLQGMFHEDRREALAHLRASLDADEHPGILAAIDEQFAELAEGGPSLETLKARFEAARAAGDDELMWNIQAELGLALLEVGDNAAWGHLEEAAFNVSYSSALGQKAIAALVEAGRA